KQVVVKEIPGIVARATIDGYIADDNAVRAKYEDKVTFNEEVPEIRQALDKINEEGLPDIIEAAKKRGATDPKAIADAYLKNLEHWHKLSEEKIKGDTDALAKALWDEIYSKVKF